MNFRISLILTIISGLSTVLGTFILFINPNINRIGKDEYNKRIITLCLSFSLSIMIIISLFELIPNSLSNIVKNYGFIYGIIISILCFILGYLSIFLLDNNIKSNNDLKRIGVMNLISLIIHNFPEGIIVFMSTSKNIKLGIKMCLAIMFHNIPEGISISVPLFYSKECSRRKAIFLTFISGISEVIGGILCYLIFKEYINELIIAFIEIFTAGIMISLSLTKILKEVISQNASRYILMGISLSCFVSLILLFI